MKTKIFSGIFAFLAMSAFSQVGIGTANPLAMLDVNGTIKIRNTPVAPALTGYQILVLNDNTGGDSQVAQIDPQLIINAAVNTFNTTNINTSMYAAKKVTSVSLLSVGLFPTGFKSVNFVASERTVGAASLFSDTDNTYTVPSNGVYAIEYSFRYGTGVQAAVLTNNPGVGILRTRAGVATILDSRTFSGINAVLLSLTISEASINSIYTLQAGDKLSFGITGTSVLEGSILSSSTGSFYIYKISN